MPQGNLGLKVAPSHLPVFLGWPRLNSSLQFGEQAWDETHVPAPLWYKIQTTWNHKTCKTLLSLTYFKYQLGFSPFLFTALFPLFSSLPAILLLSLIFHYFFAVHASWVLHSCPLMSSRATHAWLQCICACTHTHAIHIHTHTRAHKCAYECMNTHMHSCTVIHTPNSSLSRFSCKPSGMDHR